MAEYQATIFLTTLSNDIFSRVNQKLDHLGVEKKWLRIKSGAILRKVQWLPSLVIERVLVSKFIHFYEQFLKNSYCVTSLHINHQLSRTTHEVFYKSRTLRINYIERESTTRYKILIENTHTSVRYTWPHHTLIIVLSREIHVYALHSKPVKNLSMPAHFIWIGNLRD